MKTYLTKAMFVIMNSPDEIYEFDMDEIQALWEALLIYHKTPIPEWWDAFINEVNCVKAEDINWFTNLINKYDTSY